MQQHCFRKGQTVPPDSLPLCLTIFDIEFLRFLALVLGHPQKRRRNSRTATFSSATAGKRLNSSGAPRKKLTIVFTSVDFPAPVPPSSMMLKDRVSTGAFLPAMLQLGPGVELRQSLLLLLDVCSK